MIFEEVIFLQATLALVTSHPESITRTYSIRGWSVENLSSAITLKLMSISSPFKPKRGGGSD